MRRHVPFRGVPIVFPNAETSLVAQNLASKGLGVPATKWVGG